MDEDRKTALLVLNRVTGEGAYSNIELNRRLRSGNVHNPAFVRELVYGVLKTRNLLDFYAGQLVTKGYGKLKPAPKNLLRLGIFQILYMDSVPDHAAVNESVNLAKKYCRGQAGMVNGVLRNFLRRRDQLKDPDKISDPVRRLSVVYSCDEEIVRRLMKAWGADRAEDFLRASGETPDLMVTVNRTRISREDLAEELKDQGFEAEITGDRQLTITGSGVLETEAFHRGDFFVQDRASCLAVEALGPKAGDTLIDVCAAPGGKSYSAAELMGGEGRILAFDIYDHKTDLIRKGARKLGFGDMIRAGIRDASKASPELAGKADCVIADVPCSGIGVIRRKPEIRYGKFSESENGLPKIQYNILERSADLVRPGGRLMYSTCTVLPEENGENADRFLAGHAEFREISRRQLTPDQDGTDGFFYCIMEKTTEKTNENGKTQL